MKLTRRDLVSLLPLIALPAWAAPVLAAPTDALPAGALIEPAALAARLKAAASPPVLLQVGFKVLYDRAHIPASDYAGPGREPEGLALLRKRVADLPKATPIVIYCGCCPWDHCPNVAASYQVLSELGFTHVQALHIAENFGTDWIEKGYPAVQAH